MKLIFSIVILSIGLINNSHCQDYVKLKVLDRAIKCEIIDENDSLLVFRKLNSSQVLSALFKDLDWYYYENGTGKNFTPKEVKQSDFDNAFEYVPPAVEPESLISMGGFSSDDSISFASENRTLPFEIYIRCDAKRVFAIVAEELLNSGFLITQSNSEIYSITTDYSSFDATFLKGLLLGTLGVDNFMMAVSALVCAISPDSSKLIIRGKVRFTERPSVIEKVIGGDSDYKNTKVYMIRRDTDMIKPIEALAERIKTRAEE